MANIKTYQPSLLDRLTVAVGCMIISLILLGIGNELYDKDFLFAVISFFISSIVLILGGIGFSNPLKVIIAEDGVTVKSPLGFKKKCKWKEMKDFEFKRYPRAPYKVMEFNKHEGRKFKVIIVNEKIISEITSYLNDFDINEVMDNYNKA